MWVREEAGVRERAIGATSVSKLFLFLMANGIERTSTGAATTRISATERIVSQIAGRWKLKV
jgi:hypothetical protein